MSNHMRVFVAGAAGALGLPLVRRLVSAGHAVTGLTRSAAKRPLIETAGAGAVVADALDATAVARAVRDAAPTHVVNLLTALPPAGPLRPRDLRATNTLRTQGAANLLGASIAAGAARIVAESFVSVVGRPETRRALNEDDPLGPLPPGDPAYETVMALRSLEDQHAEARGQGRIETVVLRYGLFYGPEVASIRALIHNLRAGRMFLPKGTPGLAPWIQIEDAVAATMAALEHPRPNSIYHVADDEPMTFDTAMTIAARIFSARAPKTLPAWIVRLAAPLVVSMASAHLALDNGRAKWDLDWRPTFPTIREGFADLAARERIAA
jgi:2-alkyl-3-oxoalkanoate reductase